MPGFEPGTSCTPSRRASQAALHPEGLKSTMDSELPIRIVLVAPPAGIDYGIQHGSGSTYETLFVQQQTRGDVSFDFDVRVADTRKDGQPNFLGPFVQGPPTGRFIYVDVGTYAGQKNTPWARRMKIPLGGITWALIKKARSKSGQRLVARIQGTGKDGGPVCATVALIDGWEIGKG